MQSYSFASCCAPRVGLLTNGSTQNCLTSVIEPPACDPEYRVVLTNVSILIAYTRIFIHTYPHSLQFTIATIYGNPNSVCNKLT